MSNLYDVARQITIQHGFDWTDPRTGKTHKAPRKQAGKRKAKRRTKKSK